MRIAIVDDDREFAKEAEKTARRFCEDADIRCLTEGGLLLEEIEAGKDYDIYILDVEMPNLDGLELARQIREKDTDAEIVILSNFDKYALPAYKVRPYDYIVKQEYEKELPAALDGILQERLRKEKEDVYFVENDKTLKLLWFDEILYLEKEKKKKYTVIHCVDGQVYSEKLALEKVYGKLPKERFLYINRGHVINMGYVTCLEKEEIVLADSITLPVSRYRAPDVKDALAGYWRRKW